MSDGDVLRKLAESKSPLQRAEEEIDYLKSIKTNNDTKDGIMQAYWLEFLRWVKKFNDDRKQKVREAVQLGTYYTGHEREASEINFWHWYIDNKLEQPHD